MKEETTSNKQRGSLMKKNKRLIISCIGALIISFIAVFMPLICVVYLGNDNIVLLALDVFILIFIAYSVYRILIEWLNIQLEERCEFKPHLDLLEKQSKMVIYKNGIQLHFALLRVYLLTGMYNEALSEIKKLEGWHSKLSNLQKMKLRISYISYLREIESSLITEEIERTSEILTNINGVKNEEKERLSEFLTLQKLLLQKQWEEIIKLYIDKKVINTFEQVEKSYLLGLCYFNTEKYEECGTELKFVVNYGGDTKYVLLANKMLEKIPTDKEVEKNIVKYNNRKISILKFALLLIILVGCFLFVNFYPYRVSGSSVLEVYCKNYNINKEDEVQVIYQQNIDNYEYVIICDSKNIAYGLYEKKEDRYKLCCSYRVSLKDMNPDYPDYIAIIAKKAGDENFPTKSSAQHEVWLLIKNFYQKEEIFEKEGFECVGVSFYSDVEEIEISGQKINIEETITINGTQAFFWKVEDVDLETVEFFDIEFN